MLSKYLQPFINTLTLEYHSFYMIEDNNVCLLVFSAFSDAFSFKFKIFICLKLDLNIKLYGTWMIKPKVLIEIKMILWKTYMKLETSKNIYESTKILYKIISYDHYSHKWLELLNLYLKPI